MIKEVLQVPEHGKHGVPFMCTDMTTYQDKKKYDKSALHKNGFDEVQKCTKTSGMTIRNGKTLTKKRK